MDRTADVEEADETIAAAGCVVESNFLVVSAGRNRLIRSHLVDDKVAVRSILEKESAWVVDERGEAAASSGSPRNRLACRKFLRADQTLDEEETEKM